MDENLADAVPVLPAEGTAVYDDSDAPALDGTAQDEQQSWEVVVENRSFGDAVPASYVSEVPNEQSPETSRSGKQRPLDVVARGIMCLHDARVIFERYLNRLDHFIYCVLGDLRNLEEVRNASPLLTDAICTVGTLHSNSTMYSACRTAFMSQVSKQMFSKRHTVDDVRGLLIGAFWLSDLSWALMGLAVRIATEINLHRSFVRPDYASRTWYLNARLYLLVWTCDHHFSIMYGRSPLTESFPTLGFGKGFLDCEHACQDDRRLWSQVELWMISYHVYKRYGIDDHAPLPDGSLSDFRRNGIALDTWRADWEDCFTPDANIGNYPRKGISLHYHFAKLYLCSHAYRGLLLAQTTRQGSAYGLEEFAAKAVHAADSILRIIVADVELQSHLNGLPTYYDTMIAFAVVFLLKAASKPPAGLRVDKAETLGLLQQISDVLARVANTIRSDHILSSISRSVREHVEEAATTNFQTHPQIPSTAAVDDQAWQQPMDNMNFDWLESLDNSMLGNFDLIMPVQDMDFNFMDFSPETQQPEST